MKYELSFGLTLCTETNSLQTNGRERGRSSESGGLGRRAVLPGRCSTAATDQQRSPHNAGSDTSYSIQYGLNTAAFDPHSRLKRK